MLGAKRPNKLKGYFIGWPERQCSVFALSLRLSPRPVTVAQGVAMDEFVYPVVISGTMIVAPAVTDIAQTGYPISTGGIVPAE